eukprot:366094-Chlamydomonas_euryale.AAC.5
MVAPTWQLTGCETFTTGPLHTAESPTHLEHVIDEHARELHARVDGGADGAAQWVPHHVVKPREELLRACAAWGGDGGGMLFRCRGVDAQVQAKEGRQGQGAL